VSEAKFNFLTDVQARLEVGQLWPMKSGSMMMVREILSWGPPIRGTIEGGFCQGSMFSWNADGTCNNGDYQFQLKTPEERERMNRPKEETHCESWDDGS
jgi:hypothetical protein